MVTKCDFEFLKQQPVYYSGDTVEGRVNLKTSEDKIIQKISVCFSGECTTSWEEPVEGNRNNDSPNFGRNELWARKTLAYESIEVHGPGMLPADTYSYYFNFQLGSHYITSCEGIYGCVRYEILFLIEIPNSYDEEFITPITVIKPFDLNKNPIYKQPQASEFVAATCCWTNSIGRSISMLSTSFSAFAPGQIVAFNVGGRTTSKNKILGFIVKLIRKITFISKHPKKSEVYTEDELASNYRPARRSLEYNVNGSFVIPATPPTTCRRDLINIEYFLRARAVTLCYFSANIKLELRIVIGTVPVRETLSPDQFVVPSQQQQDLPDAGNEDAIVNLVHINCEIEPPTFEMGIPSDSPFVNRNASQSHYIDGFRPLYPVYRMPPRETAV